MKLTVENNRETIKRFDHLRPGSPLGGPLCGARFPDAPKRCGREKGHRGPHVAYGLTRKAVAVWDEAGGNPGSRAVGRKMAPAPQRTGEPEGTTLPVLKTVVRQIVQKLPPPEEAFLLVFFVGMVVAGIHWILLMLG